MRVVATDTPLADPATLAVWLRVPADDALLLVSLMAASNRFRGAVGHEVSLVENEQVTLDGNGREALLLPVWPTIAVSEVLLDGEELVEGTDYDWSEAGVLRRLGCQFWPARLRCIKVTYSHGWAEIPSDISEAVIEQARAGYGGQPGLKSKAVGGQSVTWETGVTSQWSQAVERHQVQTGSDA